MRGTIESLERRELFAVDIGFDFQEAGAPLSPQFNTHEVAPLDFFFEGDPPRSWGWTNGIVDTKQGSFGDPALDDWAEPSQSQENIVFRVDDLEVGSYRLTIFGGGDTATDYVAEILGAGPTVPDPVVMQAAPGEMARQVVQFQLLDGTGLESSAGDPFGPRLPVYSASMTLRLTGEAQKLNYLRLESLDNPPPPPPAVPIVELDQGVATIRSDVLTAQITLQDDTILIGTGTVAVELPAIDVDKIVAPDNVVLQANTDAAFEAWLDGQTTRVDGLYDGLLEIESGGVQVLTDMVFSAPNLSAYLLGTAQNDFVNFATRPTGGEIVQLNATTILNGNFREVIMLGGGGNDIATVATDTAVLMDSAVGDGKNVFLGFEEFLFASGVTDVYWAAASPRSYGITFEP